MSSERSERRLAAILFTDIVGYTALMAESEEKGLRVRERHRALVRPLVEQHGGEAVEARGDESLSVFHSTLDAVQCALEIQDRLEDDSELKLHIGIHTGDIVVQAGEVSGDGVNIASRICSLSEGGGLCVSGEVYRSIRNQPDIQVIPLGERELKNVGQPVAVFVIGRPGAVLVEPPTVGTRARLWQAVAALAVAAIAVLAWWGWDRQAVDAGSIRSIAVLPLENLSNDPEQEYFADGMTEALIGDLARIGSLRVISRTSVLRYKRTRKAIPEIARELGVDALVEGTALRVGNRVRITAQLIDARRDAHLWAGSYERDFSGVLALQSEVARAIVAEIALQLTPAEAARLAQDRQVDPAAYEAYLKGRHFQGTRTSEGFERAIEQFERAIEADPGYAPAYVGLADTYALLGVYSLAPREASARAKAAALKALEIDPDLAEAHARLGAIRLLYEWDWEGAERDFQRALELNPNHTDAHRLYGIYLASVGRGDEALREYERARELDPLSPIINAVLGASYVGAGQIEQGIRQLQETLRLAPDFLPAHRYLASAYWQLGRPDAAAAELQRAVELSKRPMEILAVAGSYAYMGRNEESIRLLEEVLQRAPQNYVDPGWVAAVYVELGDLDNAFEWLERAYRERSTRLYSLRVTPSGWDSIRSDPRFQDLVRRVGIPE